LRKVGLHLRITGSLTELIDKAVRLELPFFQSFFTDRKTGTIVPDEVDLRTFLLRRRIYFNNLYLHSSYFVNLADIDRKHHPLLLRELRLARKVEFTHMVIHPGTVRSAEDKEVGVDAVARIMNYLLKREHDIQFLLENTAYGQRAIGSAIEDFHLLLTKLDQPDRIGFCVDTVHAHVAGYDIVSEEGYGQFIDLLEKTVGLERVKLIHLNETCEERSSYTDIHCCIGEKQAVLGEASLKRFIRDKRFESIPILTELPVISEEDERRILGRINTWMFKE